MSPTLGTVLRRMRTGRGMSRQQLADAAGVSISGLAAIEGSKSNPYVSTVEYLVTSLAERHAFSPDEIDLLARLTEISPERLRAMSARQTARAVTTPSEAVNRQALRRALDHLVADAGEPAVASFLGAVGELVRSAQRGLVPAPEVQTEPEEQPESILKDMGLRALSDDELAARGLRRVRYAASPRQDPERGFTVQDTIEYIVEASEPPRQHERGRKDRRA